MQFSGNSVQKRVNSVQKRVNSVQKRVNSVQKRVNLCKERNKSDILMVNNQRNSQIANQMRALDVATKFENLKI